MGNCSLKGVAGKCPHFIRIMTDSGRIIELEGPLLVESVVNDFPGYGVFRQGHISSRLSQHEQLLNGQMYYLLPLVKERTVPNTGATRELDQVGPLRSSSCTASDLVMNLTTPALEVLPSPGNGIWKVKLVIDTKQLEEILSEQVNIEAMIEKMRTVASSASATPKRVKGSWGVAWRPTLASVCKVFLDQALNPKECAFGGIFNPSSNGANSSGQFWIGFEFPSFPGL
ncbi:hypothetical protein HHK36_029173 [Tetracentron sinense]|uniref:Uncharacterized protein n=1 Tax=Tetracentron sinense TaxID=13715 RepID=A0A834YH47_TETSI|nr:hypothetical protein HHK36_029173 [Tetracentron sinense]